MAEEKQNGHPGKPVPNRDYDPETGRFIAGNHTGRLGGRPPRPDFLTVLRLEAEAENSTEEEKHRWLVARLWQIAQSDDKDRMQAIKILVEQTFGAVGGGLELNVNNDNRQVTVQVPTGDKWKEWARRALALDDDDPGATD